MLFAQRGPTMVLRDHRWPTLCEAGAKVGQLTAASLIWLVPFQECTNIATLWPAFLREKNIPTLEKTWYLESLG